MSEQDQVTTYIRMPREMRERLESLAVANERNISQQIRMMLNQQMQEEPARATD